MLGKKIQAKSLKERETCTMYVTKAAKCPSLPDENSDGLSLPACPTPGSLGRGPGLLGHPRSPPSGRKPAMENPASFWALYSQGMKGERARDTERKGHSVSVCFLVSRNCCLVIEFEPAREGRL